MTSPLGRNDGGAASSHAAVVLWARASLALLVVAGVLASCGTETRDHATLSSVGGAGACGECGGTTRLGGNAGVGEAASPSVAGAAGGASNGAAGAGGVPTAQPELSITQLLVAQTLEVPLESADAAIATADRPAPLIAGKRAQARALLQVLPSFAARTLRGVLDLQTPTGTHALVSELPVTKSSEHDDPSTCFVFDIDAQLMTPKTAYRLRVLEADNSPLLTFPVEGFAPLDAQALPPFKVVLLPLSVGGYEPRLTEVEVAALNARLLALYPAAQLDWSVLPAQTLSGPLDAAGQGWDAALDAVLSARKAAAVPHDVFYYGVLGPAASYDDFCADGCVLGLSHVAAPEEVSLRAGMGVGVFGDGSGANMAADTLAHELGHALGREHAPCGDPDAPDPDFPYKNGSLGSVFGYDFDAMSLVQPRTHRDVMGYCNPVWISDYTYRGIFERLSYIADESVQALALQPRERFWVARLDSLGHARWIGTELLRGWGSRKLEQVPLLDEVGRLLSQVSVRFARLDHLSGGTLWVRERDLSSNATLDLRSLGAQPLAVPGP